MASEYMFVNDFHNSNELSFPVPGGRRVFGVDVDPDEGLYSLRYPSLSADEAARLHATEPSITIHTTLAGQATFMFGGAAIAPVSGDLDLKFGKPYVFDAGEAFTFNGIHVAVRGQDVLRNRSHRGDGRPVVVAFSGFSLEMWMEQHCRIVSPPFLAQVVLNLSDMPMATHLVVGTSNSPSGCGKFLRSAKLLAAACLPGVSVVNFKWVRDSLSAGKFLDASSYAPWDCTSMATHGCVPRLLSSPRGFPSLAGVAVFINAESDATCEEFNTIVRYAGGVPIEDAKDFDLVAEVEPEAVIAWSENWRAELPAWRREDHRAIHAEGIMRAILNKEPLDVATWECAD